MPGPRRGGVAEIGSTWRAVPGRIASEPRPRRHEVGVMRQVLEIRDFEAVTWRLSLAGDGQPLAELAGAVRWPGRSPKRTREATGESPDPSGEFPDWSARFPERSGDFLKRGRDAQGCQDQTWDVARETRVKLSHPFDVGDCLNPTHPGVQVGADDGDMVLRCQSRRCLGHGPPIWNRRPS